MLVEHIRVLFWIALGGQLHERFHVVRAIPDLKRWKGDWQNALAPRRSSAETDRPSRPTLVQTLQCYAMFRRELRSGGYTLPSKYKRCSPCAGVHRGNAHVL